VAKPTFSKSGAATWTSDKGEAVPYSRTKQPNQYHEASEDGTDQVVDLGSSFHMIPLTFVHISSSNYDDLITFFDDGNVNWSANTFTYTDSGSTGHTVRLIPRTFKESKTAAMYTVSMTLKET